MSKGDAAGLCDPRFVRNSTPGGRVLSFLDRFCRLGSGSGDKLAANTWGRPDTPLAPDRAMRKGVVVEPAEDLCRACGLCCDGTLFDLVKLEADDDARKLKALGLPVTTSRGKTPVTRFPQPCAALGLDRSCRLYADRPRQCRVFECGVLKAAKAGRISYPAALRLIKQARRRADKVRRLLRALGDTDEHRALGERFHRTSERMEAGGADAEAGLRYADLSLAVHQLKLQAHAQFYTKTEGHD